MIEIGQPPINHACPNCGGPVKVIVYASPEEGVPQIEQCEKCGWRSDDPASSSTSEGITK